MRVEVQPPSGGCVLKPQRLGTSGNYITAAFRRLCVETKTTPSPKAAEKAAAFRRLCVETIDNGSGTVISASRLQAAVC